MSVERRSVADLVAVAHVLRSGGDAHLHLELRVMGPRGQQLESLEGSKRIHVEDPPAFVAALFQPLQELADAGSGKEEKLAGVCADLAGQLIPEPIADRLAAIAHHAATSGAPAPTLCIYSNETWIPWEILKLRHPGTFLARSFAFTRWLRGPRAALSLPMTRIGLVVPNDSELPHATLERTTLLGLRSVEHEVEEVPAHYLVLLRELSGGRFDGWHFSGHGLAPRGSPEMWGIQLEGAAELGSADLADKAHGLGGTRPLVFLNACHSARGGYSLTALSGLARAFLDAGAGAFLGAHWEIPDERARRFAAAFYALFLAGTSLGEAARQARVRLWMDDPGDPTALAYAVFGDPLAASTWPAEQAAYRPPVVAPGLQRSLAIPRQEYRLDVSPPGALLRADYAVVPFHGRERELEDLAAWASGTRAVSVRLYTGAGGMGKTRLALEACLRLRDEGWRAGFVATDAEDSPSRDWDLLRQDTSPLLLVVDYAESSRRSLAPLLRAIREVRSFPVRVLLLARAALDWWEQLKAEPHGVGELLSSAATERISLAGLATDRAARARSYRLAAEAFAGILDREAPDQLPADLEAGWFDRILLLHMAALATIQGTPVAGEQSILDFVLDRESRFWRERARLRGLPETLAFGIGRAMAAITLGGGVESEREAISVIRGLAFFAGEPEPILTTVARLLHELYPGDPRKRWIEPMLPDLLGEHLVQRELERGADELLDLVMGPRGT